MAKRDPNQPVKAPPKKTVHVLSLEHYHFPREGTNDWSGDMVAATPLLVVDGRAESGDYLRVQAHRKAAEQAAKYYKRKKEDPIGVHTKLVKEGRTSSPNEYRVWVESGVDHQDRFVWIVREVEFRA